MADEAKDEHTRKDESLQHVTRLRMAYADKYGSECQLGVDEIEQMIAELSDDTSIIEEMRANSGEDEQEDEQEDDE